MQSEGNSKTKKTIVQEATVIGYTRLVKEWIVTVAMTQEISCVN